MSESLHRGRAFAMGLALLATLISGCSCGDDPDPNEPKPPTPLAPIAFKISGVLLDARTQALLGTKAKVTIRSSDGRLATNVADSAGKRTSEFETSGLLSFALAEGVQAPVKLVVVAEARGHVSSSARIEVTGPSTTFTIPMTNLANAPMGVATNRSTSGRADASGAVTTPISVSTGGGGTDSSVTLSIPVGTRLTDLSGTPLTGAITTEVTSYSNQVPDSVDSFPGGFEVAVSGTPNPGQEGSFVSGGFTAISMRDASGRQVKTFSPPIRLAMQVPAQTLNPETGRVVAPGDVVPLWSYDETTGVWTLDGNVALGSSLTATASISHLSYWNLDWFLNNCTSYRSITINGLTNGAQVTYVLRRPGGGYSKTLSTTARSLELVNGPGDVAFVLDAFFEGMQVGTLTIDTLCAPGPQLALNLTLPATSATLQVSVNSVCPPGVSPTTASTPMSQATVYLFPTSAPSARRFALTDGEGHAAFEGLTPGVQYSVFSENRREPAAAYLQQDIGVVDGANALQFDWVVPAEGGECQIITGGGGSGGT